MRVKFGNEFRKEEFSINFVKLLLIVTLPFLGLFSGRKTISILLGSIVFIVFLTLSRLICTSLGLGLLIFIIFSCYLLGIIFGLMKIKHFHFKLTSIAFSFSLTVLLTFSAIQYEQIYGIKLFYIPSSSMEPTLLNGDIILVDLKAYKNRSPLEDDIIIFKRPSNQLIYVKRVLQVDERGILVKGDNTTSTPSQAFGYQSYESVVGKAKFVLFNPTQNNNDLRIGKTIK